MIQLKQLTIASWITIYRITIVRLVISLKFILDIYLTDNNHLKSCILLKRGNRNKIGNRCLDSLDSLWGLINESHKPKTYNKK